MKNTLFRTFMKTWITIVSLAAFIGGWIIFGHSGKPVSATTSVAVQDSPVVAVTPLPTLAPLTGLSDNTQNLQALPAQPQFQLIRPRLRTRGS